jgi:hypothetical protein
MTAGISLHIGLNQVSAAHYAGWSGPLNACEADARDMRGIAASRGFEPQVLLTRDATRAKVAAALTSAASRLQPGDIFLLSYSGHGGQAPDKSNDEDDGLDETWCLYDGQLLDDELCVFLAAFRAGVRVVVLSDSCHSGTIVRVGPPSDGDRLDGYTAIREMPAEVADATYAANRDFYDAIKARVPQNARSNVLASVLQLSACQDNEVAGDGQKNGVFTGALLKAWHEGTFGGDYVDLARAIKMETAPRQTPNLVTMGQGREQLSKESPFLVGSPHSTSTSPMVASPNTSSVAWDSLQQTLLHRWSASAGVLPTEDDLAMLNSQLAQKGYFGSYDIASSARMGERANRGGTVVRAFWWGFHIEISHEDLTAFLNSADPINAAIGAIGGAIPSPASPFIALAAAFVAGALGLLRSLDQGNGVYVSMSWFAPGAFVPTTVPTRSELSRGPGDIVEFDSDRIPFGPNWKEDRFIDFRLPEGGVRDGDAVVYAAPGSNGNCYFVRWHNPDDPRDGRFWLHIGSPLFGGGGQCVWVVNGHYETLDVFPKTVVERLASKSRKRFKPGRAPQESSGMNGHGRMRSSDIRP